MLLFYDMTDRQTFADLNNYINFLFNQLENIRVFIVGTKQDLAHLRVVGREEVAEFSRRCRCSFAEVSSLTGRHVERAFDQFVEELADHLQARGLLAPRSAVPDPN